MCEGPDRSALTGEEATKLDEEKKLPGEEGREVAYPDEIADAQAAPLIREIVSLKDRNDELKEKYMRLMSRCRQYHVSADKLSTKCDRLEKERDELEKRVHELESGNELMSVVTDTWVRNLTGRSLSGAASASEKAVLIDTGFKRWSNSLDSLKANNDALRLKNEELETERAKLVAIVDMCAPVMHERVLGWGPMDPKETLDEKERVIEDGLIDIEDMVRAAEEAAHIKREMEDMQAELADLRTQKASLEAEKEELESRAAGLEGDHAQLARIADGYVAAMSEKVLDRAPADEEGAGQDGEDVLRDGFAAISGMRSELQQARDGLDAAKGQIEGMNALLDECETALTGHRASPGRSLEEREASIRSGIDAIERMRLSFDKASSLRSENARVRSEVETLDKDKDVLATIVDVCSRSMQELVLERGPLTGRETLEDKSGILMDGIAKAVEMRRAARDSERLERKCRILEEERDEARRRAAELERGARRDASGAEG